MPFPKDVASLLEILAKLPQQKIAKSLSVLLAIYIAYLAAQLTWLMIPQENNSFNASSYTYQPQESSGAFKVNIETLSALNLFGDHAAPSEVEDNAPQEVVDAPKTSLNVTLVGVVASDNKNLSAAIIQSSGTQETYGVGDMITGTRAKLENVLADRVLIKHSGRIETLMLDSVEYQPYQNNAPKDKKHSKADKSSQISNIIDKRNSRELKAEASNFKEEMDADPSNLSTYLKIMPYRKKGEIIGYSLRPGKNPKFFNASGLKKGDIAVQLNGYDLVQPLQAAQALQALKTEQEVSLLVDRDGDVIEIIFSVN